MASRAPSRAAALVIGIVLAFLVPARSHAQSMYLDTDGDGVRTAADVVAPSGPTLVGVWLRTDANRNGGPAVCMSGDGELTISSYEVILRASNGVVSWDALSNAMAAFQNDLGTVASGSDAHVSFGGGTMLPPGLYHLANAQVSVASGTPSIGIVASTPLSPFYRTAFGSQCSGLDFDNTLKLGGDWFDVDGIPYGGAANQSPALGPVAAMTVAEGDVAEQTIHASDPEGSPVTFVKVSGPAYMSVSTIDSVPPDPTGRIRLEPDYVSAGTAEGVVGASDGFITSTASFAITVPNTQRAPVLGPQGDAYVTAGTFDFRVAIFADDPDQEATQIQFLVSGPPWISVVTFPAITLSRVDGEMLISPSRNVPLGDYPVILLASKGSVADSALFTVHVFSVASNSPPYITGMPDVGVAVGTSYLQQFTAVDPDGDPMTLSKAAGPDYMAVTQESQSLGYATGLVTLTPGPSDVGGAIGILEVSDGSLSNQAFFTILAVDPGRPGATLLGIQGEPGDYVSQGQSYSYAPPTTEFTARVDTTSGVVLFLSTPPAGDFWTLRFSAPDGAHLTPGFYTGAARAPFQGTAPGLSIEGQGRGCNTLAGLFEVKQLEVGPDGALRSFWARFEQHCELAAPGLTGEVRINANADLAVTAPLSRKATIGDVVTFPVTAVSATGSAITLRVLPPLPEGAEFIDYGNGTGTFTWRPLAPLAPTAIVFEARDADGRVDRSTTLLSAGERVLTSLTLFSDPGDPVGNGVDRTFGASEILPIHYDYDPNRLYFQVTAADGSGSFYLYFRAADLGRIVPGVYGGTTGEGYHTPGTPTLEVIGAYNPCGYLTGRFEVKEATYDDQGLLTAFDAYFSQVSCSQFAITGEIRLNAHPAIEVDVPLSRTVREGESTMITATAPPLVPVSYTLEGLPPGATFADLGDNSARLTWGPDFSQAGVYAMRLVASRADGATTSIPLRLNVLNVDRPPVADAGGPYDGAVGVPVEFDGSGSSDPDGDPILFFWTFGDSTDFVSGIKVFHTYAAAGEYKVLLAAIDPLFLLYDADSTTASIHANLPARLFVSRGNREIRLTSGKAAWCAQLEAIRSAFSASDVVLSSLVLVSDSTSGPVSRIPALLGKSSALTDTDGNGIDEVTVCFAKEDLRQLFAYVSGKSVERIIVEGLLANGNRIRAVMQIEVVGASGKTALVASPNPLNPETVLTYWLSRESRLRLRIFDVAGRLVATLADGTAPQGYGSVRWRPDRVASGVYYASLETETERRTLRLVVLK